MIKLTIDILEGEDWDCFDVEITPFENNKFSYLKSYNYSLYNDGEEPILTGEVHNHDDNAGPIQLVRRVINNIKM